MKQKTLTPGSKVIYLSTSPHPCFKLGATHSFENLEFAKKLACKPNEMDIQM